MSGTRSASRSLVHKIRITLILTGLWLLTQSGCGASLPGPPLVKHPDSAFEEVPYPPPAVLTETVTKRPSQSGCVWVEGSWRFRAKTYAWRRGGWFAPPQNARYARPKVVYLPDGRVMFAPGLWYDSQGRVIDHIRPLVPAATPKNEFTAESETAR